MQAFSFHQMAVYDLPGSVDYIIKTTGFKNVSYYGHSQGTTTMFLALSLVPGLHQKINAFVALAPVFSLKYVDIAIFKVSGVSNRNNMKARVMNYCLSNAWSQLLVLSFASLLRSWPACILTTCSGC